MADWFTVEGMKPYDGRYELDIRGAPLTVREWGWIKRYAGYLPVTLDENTFTDPETVTVLALIAIRRAGTIDTGQVAELWDRFADAPFGSAITWKVGDADQEEDDADGPPAASSNGSASFSGDSSPTGSASSGRPPSTTGEPLSAISASAPATPAT